MTGYRVVNLNLLVEELGEDTAKRILSDFSCPMNADVEFFLSQKAIDFAKQGWAQTHLIFASFKNQWVLVGFFALANKYIRISAKSLGKSSNSLAQANCEICHLRFRTERLYPGSSADCTAGEELCQRV